ncbi:hypothetical protein B0H13DRAFT_1510513, partial [Mycena leptocephala]
QLRLGSSSIHKVGIFACKKFSQGEKVAEYTGEIVGRQVADRRGAEYNKKGLDTYLFTTEGFTIDATMRGNIA